MKDFTSSKEAETIYYAMAARLTEFRDKLLFDNFNAATWLAFQVGFISDIDGALKGLGIKRTAIPRKRVRELEVKDVDGDIDLEAK